MKVPIKIYAVGDMMLGEQPLCNNFGVPNIIKKKGADYLFENVRSIFSDGDIVFGNLECSIMDDELFKQEKSLFFCAEPQIINGLKNANFNVLSVANNHIMEQNESIFRHTVKVLQNNGIHPIGCTNDICVFNIKDQKIALMAYSFIEDNAIKSGYNKIQTEEAILTDIQRIRSDVDMIIISIHWGSEYVPYPSPEQVRIGRALIDAGADIILGGHPHVTQGFEIYKGKAIIYSLGNFIFDQTYISTTTDSFIIEITVNDSLEEIDVTTIPMMIGKKDYRPLIPNADRKKEILATVDEIRTHLEGRTLEQYFDFIDDYDKLSIRYKKYASRKMKVQFLSNIFRYSPLTIFLMLKQFVSRRIVIGNEAPDNH